MSDLHTYIEKEFKLPSPPAIAIRILDAVKDEHATSESLSKIISSDPALAARILKLANSSFYSGHTKIDSIDRAITVMGTGTLKNIALSFAIASVDSSKVTTGFELNLFWRRSLTSAVGTDLLAALMGMDKGNTFVTGLLKDIGMLYMYVAQPEDYIEVFKEKMSSKIGLVEAERNIFGFDHQQVGSAILEHWSFPEQIYRPIRHHHRFTNAPDTIRDMAMLLGLSDKVAAAYHGCNTVNRVREIHRAFHHHKTIGDDEVTAFIDQVGKQSVEMLSFFDIDPGDMKPYSQLLQEANEELGKLNLSYAQLILDLKQAKQKSDKLAAELKKANAQLRQLALNDGLTSLYNHTCFQDMLLKEFSKAKRYKRHLSLIIFDLDHFKSVNDAYGHLVGDQVLRQVAQEIKNNIRNADIAARYGGEEFAVILPETDLSGTSLLGERLRLAIEEMRISNDKGIDFGVTISAGVSTYNPSEDEFSSPLKLIKDADRGLYLSKDKGRNRVSIFIED